MNGKDNQKYCELLSNTKIPNYISPQEQQNIWHPLSQWIKERIPAHLYKFRECNDNNISAFRNQQLWFATASQMNDDFDSMIFFDEEKILADLYGEFSESAIRDRLTYLKSEDAYNSMKSLLPEWIIEKCMDRFKTISQADIALVASRMHNHIDESYRTQIDMASELERNLMKFSCFSQNIESPLMWGQYAKNSTGFALAYDFKTAPLFDETPSHLIASDGSLPKCNLYPIAYSDRLLDSTEFVHYSIKYTCASQQLQEFGVHPFLWDLVLPTIPCHDTFMGTKIILHKSNDWKPENEWRMTLNYKGSKYESDKSAHTKKKPSALYLGLKIKDTDELILRNIAYQQKIPVFKMTRDSKSMEYKLKPIKQRNSKADLHL